MQRQPVKLMGRISLFGMPRFNSFIFSSTTEEKIVIFSKGNLESMPLHKHEQTVTTAILFGGCMYHENLNTFKYAVAALMMMQSKDVAPVLLANKTNVATIHLSDNPDSAAVQKAIDSSSYSGIKHGRLLVPAVYNNCAEKAC